VKESHLKDALPGDGVWTVASPRLPAGKGILASRHAQPAQLIGGSGLSRTSLLKLRDRFKIILKIGVLLKIG